ncbi:MAG: S8 family serine peptidase [Caldilineaceae bacterium]|nr:S8 family serine peptidase [Caldilineaceae bacterium]
MSSKFIALRRTPRTEAETRRSCTIEETRTQLLEAAKSVETPEQLEKIGLTPIDPCEETPHATHSFQPLPYLDAYVVETRSAKLAAQAKEILEPEYLIVSDFGMTLPVPERGRRYARLPKEAMAWPEVSGIPAAHAQGITGKGVVVCVLDTGVDADHRALRHKTIDFRYVPLDPKAASLRDCRGFDVDGHGTHVCGIIAGERLGIAPDVELLVASVLESETLKTSLQRVVIALDWILSQFKEERYRNMPFIVNMSLGFSRRTLSRREYQDAVQALRTVLKTLVEDFQVLPITAVGNEGPKTVRAPADFPGTLSVGAVDWDLQVASFSGGGVSPDTGETEPNLAGYGVEVISSFERDRHNRSLYRRMSGTSMATPFVTGIAALYAAQNPQCQGQELRKRLVETALPLEAPVDRVGAGLARFVQEATA